jgi:hypothetical protein
MLAQVLYTRSRALHQLVIASSVAALLAGAAGCQSPLAQQRLNKRTQNIERVGEAYTRSEARRPGNLQDAGEYIAANEAHHAERLDSNLREAGKLIDRDIKHFEKSAPEINKKVGELMWGKPEEIEDNAIILFF